MMKWWNDEMVKCNGETKIKEMNQLKDDFYCLLQVKIAIAIAKALNWIQNKAKKKAYIQKHKIKGKTISLRYTHHATVCISLKSILTFHRWIELTFNAMTIKCQRVEVTTNELAINKQLTIAQLVVIQIMCFGDINFHIQTLHHINSLLCLLNILFFFLLTIFIHSIPYIHLFDFISLHNYISLWLWYAPAQHHNHFIAFIIILFIMMMIYRSDEWQTNTLFY